MSYTRTCAVFAGQTVTFVGFGCLRTNHDSPQVRHIWIWSSMIESWLSHRTHFLRHEGRASLSRCRVGIPPQIPLSLLSMANMRQLPDTGQRLQTAMARISSAESGAILLPSSFPVKNNSVS